MATNQSATKLTLISLAFTFACAHSTNAESQVVDGSYLVNRLYEEHPRLILKNKDLKTLKQKCLEDEILRRCVKQVLKSADGYLETPFLKYEKRGPRLLHVSRECLRRIYTLGTAWRWTGDEKYAKRALDELLAVCSFKDWNPPHFLDTAEMSHAVGIGYDWFYHYLDEHRRNEIRESLIRNGLRSGIDSYLQEAWWARSSFNWNQVCNSGLLIGAIAIAETDPEYLEQIGPSAIANLPIALKEYGPDGVWPEGISYWIYATNYTAYGLSAMQSAFGADFGLLDVKGLSKTGYFPIYGAGPTGLFFNFADSGDYQTAKSLPVMFWLGRTYENYIFSDFAHALLAKYGSTYEHLIWYKPSSGKGISFPDLDCCFDGSVPVAVFRSSWGDPNALFLAVKGGYNQVNHGHLDLGNFEIDALGVRWVRDLGR
ncbi:MAG: heparinase, partial [Planctomycetota bacterium]